MNLTKHICCLIALLVADFSIAAHPLVVTTPPEWAAHAQFPKIMRSLAGVTLEADTLQAVESRLGRAKKFRVDQSAAADDFICYRFNSEKYLVIGSGPMGGWNSVTSIGFGIPASDVRKNCVTPLNPTHIAEQSWQRNVQSLERLAKRKTKSTSDGRRHLRYEIESKPAKGQSVGLLCSGGVVLDANGGQNITFIQVWRSCSM